MSKSTTEDLLSEVDDYARHYRRTAFRLRADMAAALRDVFAQP